MRRVKEHSDELRPQQIPASGPKLSLHQVILRPLVTEKGTHQFTHHNAYPFEVNLWATKDEIKAAVQELFSVRVEKVRTAEPHGQERALPHREGQAGQLEEGHRHAAPGRPDRVLLRVAAALRPQAALDDEG